MTALRSLPLVLAFFQLESSLMLLWGGAAVVPLLIHLWSRRQYRETPWAAMTFLLAALHKNARRIQLEQWLLLAVRTAVLLLLSLALADPRRHAAGLLGQGPRGGRTLVVLVLDGSYSMEYRAGGDSRWTEAKRQARRTVEQAALGAGFLLVRMGEPPRALIADPAFEKQDVLEEIDALALEHTAANLPQTAALVDQLLRQAQTRQPQLVERRVVWWSDLAHNTWDAAREPSLRSRLASWAEQGVQLALADVGVPAASNRAVVRLRSSEPWVIAGRTATFQAELRSWGGSAPERVAAALLVDGQRAAEARVELAPGGAATAFFTHRFSEPGSRVVEVRLTGDNLPVDDRRWLAIDVRPAVKVLCLGGRPGETRYLAAALAPDPSLGLAVTEAGESALVEQSLADYDAVFLANVGRLTADEAALLRQYVQSGGLVVIFLGDQVQAENYNEAAAGPAPLLPAKLGEVLSGGPFALDPLGYQHPLVEVFRGQPRSGLLTTPISAFVALTPNPQARRVLGFAGRSEPALVEQRLGQGRVVLCATAAAPLSLDRRREPPQPWSQWGAWPSFPPLVQELIAFAAQTREGHLSLLVGEEASGEWKGSPAAAALLSAPGERRERIALSEASGGLRWSYSAGRLAGVYELRAEGGERVESRFVLNPDPREGDLERVPPELLPAALLPSSALAGGEAAAASAAPRQEWFRPLLLAVAGLLAAESLLAFRLGRGAL